jgi:plastocyanin
MQPESRRVGIATVRLGAAVFLGVVLFLGGFLVVDGSAWTEQAPYIVSQKGRAFHPLTLNIKRGDTVRIVNDDGDLLHHAYVESSTFNFDSGDQLPGSKTDIIFSVPGTFNVLCGIHPKMKLVVVVK